MARRSRTHSPNGMYYAVLKGYGGREIFADDEDKDHLSELVARLAPAAGARVHDFCWTRSDARLAVEVSDVPLGRVIQRIAATYARARNRRSRESGLVFRHRYDAVLLDGRRERLLEVIRHIGRTPVEAGLAETPAHYRWSGYRWHAGLEDIQWVATGVVAALFGESTSERRTAYRRYVASERRGRLNGAAEQAPRFPFTPGDAPFLGWLRRQIALEASASSLQAVVNAVSRKLRCDPAKLCSRSREHEVVLARALIAWHATRHRIATLSEIGRQLSHSPSTLHEAIERCRAAEPKLFSEPLDRLLLQLVAGAPTRQ